MSVFKEQDVEKLKYQLYLKSEYKPKKHITKRKPSTSTYRIDGVEVSKSAFDLHVKKLREKGIHI